MCTRLPRAAGPTERRGRRSNHIRPGLKIPREPAVQQARKTGTTRRPEATMNTVQQHSINGSDRDLDAVLRDLLEQIADITEADTAFILLLGSESRAFGTGSSPQLDDVTEADGLDPILRAGGVK